MIDRQRAASIFGVSVLVLSLVSFGVPVPFVQKDTPETTEPTDRIHPSYDVQVQMTDGMLTQDADAALLTAAVAGVALSAGVGGTLLATGYFDKDPGDDTTASYMVDNLDDRIEGDYSNLNSSYESTRTMAYRVAETSFAESMANGSSKSEAQMHAGKEVAEYLSNTIEDEFVRRSNAYVSTVSAIDGTKDVGAEREACGGGCPLTRVETFNHTIYPSYPNASEVEVSVLNFDSGNSYINWIDASYTDTDDIAFRFSNSGIADKFIYGNTRQPKWHNLYNDYVGLHAEIESEISTFSSSVSESQYDNLSADEIVSPVNQALEWGQSYNQTGSSGYAAALASSLGYATNGTGTQYQISLPNGTTYNGTWYGDEKAVPNGTLEVGETYDGSGDVSYVATDDGTVPLDGEYTVDKIETRDGESLNKTALSTWSRDNLNASAPLTTLDKWQELREEVKSGGIGGGLFSGGGFLPLVPWDSALIDILVLLGAGYLLVGGRSGGGTVVTS